jgi:hypothetical protein
VQALPRTLKPPGGIVLKPVGFGPSELSGLETRTLVLRGRDGKMDAVVATA